MSTANPLAGPSPLRDIINPQFHQNIFSAENFIKSELNIKLDKDMPSTFDPSWITSSHPSSFQHILVNENGSQLSANIGFGDFNAGGMQSTDTVQLEMNAYMLIRKSARWNVQTIIEVSANSRSRSYMSPETWPECPKGHPKPGPPKPEAYQAPPLSMRDLGPPPPGYGRYADFDRSFTNAPATQHAAAGANSNASRRNLDEVLCFKVIEAGWKDESLGWTNNKKHAAFALLSYS
ncbi:hypothetical protein HHX47_DHR1001979 [Lentinula edodes]|nr:hypothetical protein HHX47_DHR1001979 [Lentinula edodes]